MRYMQFLHQSATKASTCSKAHAPAKQIVHYEDEIESRPVDRGGRWVRAYMNFNEKWDNLP